MGVRILKGDGHAVLYSSSTDWAFGPVFTETDEHTAEERAEAFCDWLGARDPRDFDDIKLESLYLEWMKQEDAQWKEKERKDKDED